MRIPFTSGPGTVGREDRLVRGCIALSLLLLVGFAVAMSGRSGPASLVLGVAGLYFSITAALGRDPFYAHFAIDTRSDAEFAPNVADESWAETPSHIVDLRDSHSDPGSGRSGSSLLSS